MDRPLDVQKVRKAAVSAAQRAESNHLELARLRISESIGGADARSVYSLGLYLQGLDKKPNKVIQQSLERSVSFVASLSH